MAEWDKTSAIVALVALAVMFPLSPYGPTAISSLARLFYSYFLPAKVQCESLCWDDIPEGQIYAPLKDHVFIHRDEDYRHPRECFASSFGQIFQHAWSTSQDRKWGPKPKDLDMNTTYLRSDNKTMRAQMLAHSWDDVDKGEPCFTFELIGRTLTAQYTTKGFIPRSTCGPRTKHELELLLEGYPPIFRSSIHLPNNGMVPSPLKDRRQIELPGWIVHCGLDHTGNMPYFDTENTRPFWQTAGPKLAVARFQVVLSKIQAVTVNAQLLSDAVQLYHKMLQPDYIKPRARGSEMSLAPEGFDILGFRYTSSIRSNHWTSPLTADQWQTAIQIFDHWGSFTPSQIAFLKVHVKPILQAAFVGLLQLMRFGPGPPGAWPPPSLPETRGHRYVYIRSCVDG